MTSIPNQTPLISSGEVKDLPRIILRLEGLVLLAMASMGFAWTGESWLLFGLLFLVPDISMLGYLAGPRIGATVYNIGHTTIAAVVMAVCGYLLGSTMALGVSLVWLAHIGFDRAVGYGLKYPDAFKHTHLGRP